MADKSIEAQLLLSFVTGDDNVSLAHFIGNVQIYKFIKKYLFFLPN